MARTTSSAFHSGFTLTETLTVLVILGVLAGVVIQNLSGARGAAQRQVARTYLQSCLAAAEHKRSFMTNQLPPLASCPALGLPLPQGVTEASFGANGAGVTLNVLVAVQGKAETLTGDLAAIPAN